MIFLHFRANSKTSTEEFLMKSMKHTAEDCEVCAKQVKPVTLKAVYGCGHDVSFPEDKILKKIGIPEVRHHGVTCQSCHILPIIGNTFRCFTCKDFISCESCYDSKKHEHTLTYVSSKLEKL